ncbi:hypothetical protein [Nonomuraea sp. NPDC049625]|uniref:hypothetical protein n=1 Tax=Nonomuraea sp. NPDC049625 TaxID=3155775 RepID=UPI0034123FFC
MASLRFTQMFQRLVPGAAENCTPDPLDLIDFEGIIDLNGLAEPSVDGNLAAPCCRETNTSS